MGDHGSPGTHSGSRELLLCDHIAVRSKKTFRRLSALVDRAWVAQSLEDVRIWLRRLPRAAASLQTRPVVLVHESFCGNRSGPTNAVALFKTCAATVDAPLIVQCQIQHAPSDLKQRRDLRRTFLSQDSFTAFDDALIDPFSSENAKKLFNKWFTHPVRPNHHGDLLCIPRDDYDQVGSREVTTLAAVETKGASQQARQAQAQAHGHVNKPGDEGYSSNTQASISSPTSSLPEIASHLVKKFRPRGNRMRTHSRVDSNGTAHNLATATATTADHSNFSWRRDRSNSLQPGGGVAAAARRALNTAAGAADVVAARQAKSVSHQHSFSHKDQRLQHQQQHQHLRGGSVPSMTMRFSRASTPAAKTRRPNSLSGLLQSSATLSLPSSTKTFEEAVAASSNPTPTKHFHANHKDATKLVNHMAHAVGCQHGEIEEEEDVSKYFSSSDDEDDANTGNNDDDELPDGDGQPAIQFNIFAHSRAANDRQQEIRRIMQNAKNRSKVFGSQTRVQ